MFNHYFKLNINFFLKHLFWQLVCFAFSLFAFAMFIDKVWGQVLASLFFIVYYIISAYCLSYKFGEKDSKSYSEHKPYALKGFTVVIMTLVINLILVLLYFALRGKASELVLEYFNFYIVFLLRAEGALKTVSFVLMFLIPALCSFVGYFAGYHRYELGYKMLSKLVYSNEKK